MGVCRALYYFFSFFIIHKMVERSNPETGRFLSSSTQHNVYNLRKRSHPEKSKITRKSKKTFITSRKSSITWNNLPAPVLVKILENFRNVQGPEIVFQITGAKLQILQAHYGAVTNIGKITKFGNSQ